MQQKCVVAHTGQQRKVCVDNAPFGVDPVGFIWLFYTTKHDPTGPCGRHLSKVSLRDTFGNTWCVHGLLYINIIGNEAHVLPKALYNGFHNYCAVYIKQMQGLILTETPHIGGPKGTPRRADSLQKLATGEWRQKELPNNHVSRTNSCP